MASRYQDPGPGPSCVPAELRGVLSKLSRNDRLLLRPLEQLMESIYDADVTNSLTTLAPVFNNFSGPLPKGSNPTRQLQITSDMAAAKCNAKYLDWDADTSAYVQVGSAFEIYDVFDRWAHAKTNDKALSMWDSVRGAFLILWMDTPMTRRGTIGSLLSAATTATLTDADDSTTHTVDGYFVPSGKKILGGSRIKADWSVKAKKWFCDVTNVCVVPI